MSSIAVLKVERVGPGVSLQDRGRPGWMHRGVPPGGPWDPEGFAQTLASLGAPPEAVLLEIPLHGAVLSALHPIVVSLDGARVPLEAGARLEVAPAPWPVRYLGVSGGFDAPVVLGGRGLLPVAGLGGALGRFLRAGDTLFARAPSPPLMAPPRPLEGPPRPPEAVTRLEVVAGPDVFPAAAWDTLLGASLTVSPLLDRTGTRLLGPPLPLWPPDPARASAPMVRGALQVTLDGGIIALGPDHPTTGGYPVMGVLTRAGQSALARVRPGGTLGFVIAPGCVGPRGG